MNNNKLVTSKYTKSTFLPLNLYHQLTKAQNIFFLTTLVLLSIPYISPFSPYTYLVAFMLVLGVSMVKDGIEDYRSHVSDKEYNTKITHVVFYDSVSGLTKISDKYMEDIEIGDFVVVKCEEEIPGDLIFLTSKSFRTDGGGKCHRYCFVETSNLDGEINYKKKMAHCFLPSKTCKIETLETGFKLCDCDKNLIDTIKGQEVFDTGEDLSLFECKLITQEDELIQHEKNVLLRGSKLKNTAQIFGIIVSVGDKTKLSKSAKKVKQKVSVFQRRLFKNIAVVLLFYFCILIASSILGSLFLTKTDIGYLYLTKYPAVNAFKGTGTSFILYNYLIPISLFVTLEFARFFQGLFIQHDQSMIKNNINSQCRNTNITEDLGLIEYILADKTGTITKNAMALKFFHIMNDHALLDCHTLFTNYERILRDENTFRQIVLNHNVRDRDFVEVMVIITLLCCNSVEIIEGNYEGMSQDEVAMLNALHHNRIKMISSKDESKMIDFGGSIRSIDIPLKMEFSSARQRMSVVVELYGKIFLLTKGSDQKLLSKDNIHHQIIDGNSEFRSLVICFAELSRQEYESLHIKYNDAVRSPDPKDLEMVFATAEQKLIYLGSTFIEDELQDNIKDTITSLSEAGITFWMITGDKKETAIACAINSGLLDKDYLERGTGKVIPSVDLVNNEEGFTQSLRYKSVVVYRASPDHKELIAKLFKRARKTSLAIGDGNNDVLMLETANVGVGIRGKEGTQASLAADISVPEFQCLKKLILTHGRYNLINFAIITFNSFYKNLFFILIQFYYDFFNGFSGKPVYNYYFLNYFNIFFTSLVPLYISIFNKDYPEEYLMRNPKKYKEGQRYINQTMFICKMCYSIFKSSLVFWLSFGIFYVKDFTNKAGKIGGYKFLNNYLSFIVFFAVLLRQTSNITFFVWYAYVSIFLSISAYFVTIFAFQEIDSTQNWAVLNLYGTPVFYFALIFILGLVYFLDYFYTIVKDKYIIKAEEQTSNHE